MDTATEEETLLTVDQYIEKQWTDSEEDAQAFKHYLYNHHEDQSVLNLDDWTSRYDDFRDAYQGCRPFAEFVEETFTDCNEIPEHLQAYIDWASMARDWELSGDFWTVEDGFGNEFIYRSY